jgi:hypothetical protein
MNRRLSAFLLSAVMCGSLMAVGAAPASAATCTADGVNCKVGDVGPGGGIVFYDAGSQQVWGRFLEAKTNSVLANGIWGTVVLSSPEMRLASKQIGHGASNSVAMSFDLSSVYSRLKDTAFSNGFFLPSKNELDALYNYWKISGDQRLNYAAAPMWTSSHASPTFVWYQLFQDGTQFTDANGIIPKLAGNKDFLKSPKHLGSGFEPTDFQVIGVSAFPNGQTSPAFNSVSATTANSACSAGGANTVCNIGDIGPGGGIVFYDAGKDEYWGRYLEIAPKACEGVKLPWRPAKNEKTVYQGLGKQTAAELRVLAKGIGMGKVNTRIITLALGDGTYAAKYAEDLACSGVDDWFLPSKDELDLAYNRLAQNRVGGQDTPVGGFNKGYYWTSTDYNNETAWSQYFMDGQQFDRVQILSGNRLPPANPFRVRPIRAFGTNNVVLSCAQGGTCKLGDIGPGGGRVFYVAPDRPDRLVANGKSARYMEASNFDHETKWSCINTRSGIGTRTSIGSGAYNTSLLKRACPGFYDSMLDLGDGKTDWFVPSKDELNELFKNRQMVGVFSDGLYWSSSESGSQYAWARLFRTGTSTTYSRWSTIRLRLVRAFG